ncbi:MAG: hypothetical protein FJ090_00645 [Deltaproteobacteria bacterium]|nr:hypothetical protein [Deltaproteobacteria bacterium]
MVLSITLSLAMMACSGGVLNEQDNTKDTDTATVGGDPDISVQTTEVDFGEVAFDDRFTELITVVNSGGGDLEITSIAVDSPFQVNPLSMHLTAGSTAQITLSVQPQAYEEFASAIVIESNDPDEPTVEIPVLAVTLTDNDGDGYDLVDAGGTDCDDTDVTVHPDAYEVWYDGIDQDCDGGSDYDQDGDGYESDAFNEDAADGGGDCQDSDAEYYPGAPDEPYDNRDTDCDEADDFDHDGDGSRSDDYGDGRDCDDNDAEVNTSGDEQFNGKDDDCDGDADNGAVFSTSEYMYTGRNNYDRAGWHTALGDLDGDGMAEVVGGVPYYGAASNSSTSGGAVVIFGGGPYLPDDSTEDDPTPSGDVRDADQLIEGDGSSDLLGGFVTVLGDFDEDGVDDLAVGGTGVSAGGGAVYIINGPDAMSGRDTSDSYYTLTGSSNNALGRGIATDIDLNGDGVQDLVACYTESSNNAVALVYGGSGGDEPIGNADARWTVNGTDEAFYRNAPVGGDLDGDGYQDLVLSDGSSDQGATDGGAVWAVWGQGGRYSGATSITAVGTTLMVGSSAQGIGTVSQLGPDWDGDGDAELWVFASGTALYALEGGPGRGSYTSGAAAVTYTWSDSYADAAGLRQMGDFTGDDVSDMIVYFEDNGGSGTMMHFASETQSGTHDQDTAWAGYVRGTSDHGNGNAGYGNAPLAADIDGDGDDDYAAGDPQWHDPDDASSGSEGEIYVFMNETLRD